MTISRAPTIALVVKSWRRLLVLERSFASSSAFFWFLAQRSLRESMPCSILPMALMRGARIWPISYVPTFRLMFDWEMRLLIPGLLVPANFSRPSLTIARLAPISGTRSAIVAIAASSSFSSSFSLYKGFRVEMISQANLQATPAPQSLTV